MRYPLFSTCLIWVVICLVVSGLTGWVSSTHIHGWYQTLAQPSFTPPSWLFAPVWTALYITIGIAGGMLWKNRKNHPALFLLFILQLILNFAWSFLFFVGENINFAFIDIIALWFSLSCVVALCFVQKNKMGWLLLPYWMWTSFAAVLNYFIWQLN